MAMKTILITGGAGFIGSHLIEKYLAEGHRVICLDNLQTTRTPKNITGFLKHPEFRFVKQDVIAPFNPGEKIDWIFNLACSGSYTSYQFDPVHTVKTNTIGVINMLELARKNVAAASLANRIQLEQIDAKTLPFTDGRFDVVMSNSIIHHIHEPMHSLQEAVRVTKSGSLLFFRDLLRPEDEATLIRLVQTHAGSENTHCRQMFADSLHAALSLEEIRGLVTQLGFSAESVQQTTDRHWTWIGRSIPSPKGRGGKPTSISKTPPGPSFPRRSV